MGEEVTTTVNSSRGPQFGRVPYDLIIVITAWNTPDLVRNCLQSILASPVRARFQVVVLDDAGSDNLEVVVRQFPGAVFMRNETNLGYVRANNKVLRTFRGQARYYLLLNSDTTVEPGTLDSTVDFLDAHPEAGIAGCRVVKPDGRLDWACRRSYVTPDILLYRALGLDVRFPKSRRFGKGYFTYLNENETYEVDAVVGAYLMVRGEVLEQVGLLDETYFMYSEDTDLCFRAKRAGWKVYYVPTGTVVHYKTQSGKKRSYRMIYSLYRSTWILHRKHFAARYWFPVNGLVWLGLYGMCVGSLIRNFFKSEKGLPSRH
jgi:hypothetical protein